MPQAGQVQGLRGTHLAAPPPANRALSLLCRSRSAGGAGVIFLVPEVTTSQPSPLWESLFPSLISTDSACLSWVGVSFPPALMTWRVFLLLVASKEDVNWSSAAIRIKGRHLHSVVSRDRNHHAPVSHGKAGPKLLDAPVGQVLFLFCVCVVCLVWFCVLVWFLFVGLFF